MSCCKGSSWLQRLSSFCCCIKLSCISKEQFIKYMSFFPEDDDGTPPLICGSKRCPLNHDNWINDLYISKLIGRIGFSYCDRNRKLLGAISSVFTIFAMLLTIWGCIGFSVNSSIIQRTYWAGGTVTNSSAVSNKDYTIYIGLRATAYVPCTFSPGYDYYGSSCHVDSVEWGDSQCEKGVVAGACHDCGNAAVALWFTAISSCLGLVLALMGAQTRMRVAADTPVQKMMGIVSDTCGTIALVFTLTVFDANCLYPLRRSYASEGLTATFWSGKPAYSACFIATFLTLIPFQVLAYGVTPSAPPQAGYEPSSTGSRQYRRGSPYRPELSWTCARMIASDTLQLLPLNLLLPSGLPYLLVHASLDLDRARSATTISMTA